MTVEGVDLVHALPDGRPHAEVKLPPDMMAAEDLGHALDDLRCEQPPLPPRIVADRPKWRWRKHSLSLPPPDADRRPLQFLGQGTDAQQSLNRAGV